MQCVEKHPDYPRAISRTAKLPSQDAPATPPEPEPPLPQHALGVHVVGLGRTLSFGLLRDAEHFCCLRLRENPSLDLSILVGAAPPRAARR
jgi:hypothetical protein